MPEIVKQFSTDTQIDDAFKDLSAAMFEATAAMERIGRLTDRLMAEVETARAERDALEIYNEAEAAAALRIEPRQLADLRRRLDLPHINFGSKIRYTRDHLTEIVAIFSVSRQQRPARLKAA